MPQSVSYLMIALIFSIASFLIYFMPYRKAKKQFDPTMRVDLNPHSKKMIIIALVLAVAAVILFAFAQPIFSLIPVVIVVLWLQTSMVFVGETHLYQRGDCFVIDKIKHARVDDTSRFSTKLNFKYRKNHYTINITYANQEALLARLSK